MKKIIFFKNFIYHEFIILNINVILYINLVIKLFKIILFNLSFFISQTIL